MTIALLVGEAWVKVAGIPVSLFVPRPNLVNVTIHPCVIYSEMSDYGGSYLRGLSGGGDTGIRVDSLLLHPQGERIWLRHMGGMSRRCVVPPATWCSTWMTLRLSWC